MGKTEDCKWEEFDFESNLVPLPQSSLPTPAEAGTVDARNQVCLHMEVEGSGTEGETGEGLPVGV